MFCLGKCPHAGTTDVPFHWHGKRQRTKLDPASTPQKGLHLDTPVLGERPLAGPHKPPKPQPPVHPACSMNRMASMSRPAPKSARPALARDSEACRTSQHPEARSRRQNEEPVALEHNRAQLEQEKSRHAGASFLFWLSSVRGKPFVFRRHPIWQALRAFKQFTSSDPPRDAELNLVRLRSPPKKDSCWSKGVMTRLSSNQSWMPSEKHRL